MKSHYKVLAPADLEGLIKENQAFALDVLNGLSEKPKRLSSKYFYDDEGSRLFQRIMELPEYYLTRCEYQILESERGGIADVMAGAPFNLVELGAGDGYKTNLLVEHFLERELDFTYVPVDISEAAMQWLVDSMGERHSGLTTRGLVAEYFEALKWLVQFTDRRNLVLFLGSNLGNFSGPQSRTFLRSLWNSLNNGDMVLIGFDLKKDIKRMLAAYNDGEGVTAAFNRNLLTRINRELGGNFRPERFQFHASYNVFSGAIESYLVSEEAQEVFIEAIGQSFAFLPWEPIHTEYSYKYLLSDTERLAVQTGYRTVRRFYDEKRWFTDVMWEVVKSDPEG